MKTQCIFFDFDGTIADTNQLVLSGLRITIRHFTGHTPTDESLMNIFGRPLLDQMCFYCPPKAEKMVQFYREYYRCHQHEMVKPFPYVPDTLQELKTRGYILGIVSAKGTNGIRKGVELLGITPFIDIIVSAQDVTNNKPHPEPLYKALSQTSFRPSEALMVGDSPYDIEAGNRAGIPTGLVEWTLFPRERFSQLHIDFHLQAITELLTRLPPIL